MWCFLLSFINNFISRQGFTVPTSLTLHSQSSLPALPPSAGMKLLPHCAGPLVPLLLTALLFPLPVVSDCFHPGSNSSYNAVSTPLSLWGSPALTLICQWNFTQYLPPLSADTWFPGQDSFTVSFSSPTPGRQAEAHD